MRYEASSVDDYVQQLPDNQQAAVKKLRQVINKNIPKGFEEQLSYGMIGWVIPHSLYPPGYHCNPSLPLPFLAVGAQKHFVALYHMGIYADEKLMKWFTDAWAKATDAKLDMGKSCIRFKKPEDIPFDLVGALSTKMSTEDVINLYENTFKQKRKKPAAKKAAS